MQSDFLPRWFCVLMLVVYFVAALIAGPGEDSAAAFSTMFYKLREVPSYNVTIDSAPNTTQLLRPPDASIPLNMTVIWINKDTTNHTVTASSAPENFDSEIIPAHGGWYAHQFTRAGTYHYTDRLGSSLQGTIKVGSDIQQGVYMDMIVGGTGSLPFDAANASGFVVSFVPKRISLPPDGQLTYNVTVSNGTTVTCKRSFVTDTGILDLELLPRNTTSAGNATAPIDKQFTSWGPDFKGHSGRSLSGTYHLEGPLMTRNIPYYLTVRIFSQGEQIFFQPAMIDKFTLRSVSDPPPDNMTISTGSDSNSSTSSVLFLPPQKNTG